jgi:uncharacterized membrane-anchored protein
MNDAANKDKSPRLAGIPIHPARDALAAEIHARPSRPLAAPARIASLALLTGESPAAAERDHVAALCADFGVLPPAAASNHFSADFGPADAPWGMTWERHAEFTTYTFRRPGAFAEPFAESALAAAPAAWLAAIKGQLLAAVDIAMFDNSRPAPEAAELARLFQRRTVAGSEVANGRAAMWTDFAVAESGAVRILVHNKGLTLGQAGRAVQRMCEIETYRMMALLALPLARQIGPRVTQLEQRLADTAMALNDIGGVEGERELLRQLSSLAAEVETLAAQTPYRFGAARAYHALVTRRVEELREGRIEGLTSISEFLDRRLTPAMRTCETVHARLEGLSQRVARLGNLLRTRVDVTLEHQNVELLASMDRRARVQLRLQQTVEALSIVAVTYYGVGILEHLLPLLERVGIAAPKAVATAIAVPLVAFAVWLALRRVRREPPVKPPS